MNGKQLVDRVATVERIQQIGIQQNEISSRLINPHWIPWAGDEGFLCWRAYYDSDQTQMPYPGGRLNQPEWFFHDNMGYNDIEAYCYLEHELEVLQDALGVKANANAPKPTK